jgi:SAM-dependent methyltransferase
LNFGDLARFEPFCKNWGTSRGGAIDRYYIDAFLEAELRGCRGNFLECGGMRYRPFVPRQNVVRYDVVDIDGTVPGLTIRDDIQDLRSLASNSYHVVICTQVLQYVDDPGRAIAELHRILRRGGRLFVSVPLIEKDHLRMGDRWRFTKASMQRLLSPFRTIEVSGCGNLLSSVCYLVGLGQEDIEEKALAVESSEFYHVIVAKAKK